MVWVETASKLATWQSFVEMELHSGLDDSLGLVILFDQLKHFFIHYTPASNILIPFFTSLAAQFSLGTDPLWRGRRHCPALPRAHASGSDDEPVRGAAARSRASDAGLGSWNLDVWEFGVSDVGQHIFLMEKSGCDLDQILKWARDCCSSRSHPFIFYIFLNHRIIFCNH